MVNENGMMDTLNCIASQYSSLINATLTILLVGVTGWYAFVTRKMWREMADGRLASIRPLLLISMTTLEKKQPAQGDDSLYMGRVNLSNFGRGPAYEVHVELHVPSRYQGNKTRAEVRYGNSAGGTLVPSGKIDFIYGIYNHGADVQIEHSHFLDLRCQFRDTEGNYYSVSQQLSLTPVAQPQPHCKLDPTVEEVRFSSFSRTRSRSPRHNEMDIVVSQRTANSYADRSNKS